MERPKRVAQMALPSEKRLHARGENALSSAWYVRDARLCCSDDATIREKSIRENEVRVASKDKAGEEDGKRT